MSKNSKRANQKLKRRKNSKNRKRGNETHALINQCVSAYNRNLIDRKKSIGLEKFRVMFKHLYDSNWFRENSKNFYDKIVTYKREDGEFKVTSLIEYPGEIDDKVPSHVLDHKYLLEGGYEVKLTDLRSLRLNYSYLNNEIIEAYVGIFANRDNPVKSKLMISHYATNILINRKYRGFKTFEKFDNYDVVLGPVHLAAGIDYKRDHWCCFYANLKNGIFLFIDPLRKESLRAQEICNNWKEFYERFHHEHKIENWIIKKTNHSQQTDSFNCGLFVSVYLRILVSSNLELQHLNLKFDSKSDDLFNLRQVMLKEFITEIDRLNHK